MREGLRVRVISGEHKGKTGKAIGPVPMSQVQHLAEGQDISMEGAKTFWVIEFEDGKQDLLEESNLEIIPPE